MLFSKILAVFPVIAVMALDLSFTLAFQPDNYWQDYNQCSEANPIGRALLAFNPACFALLSALYVFLVLSFAWKMQRPASILLIAFVFAGHAHGSASWSLGIPFLAEAELWLHLVGLSAMALIFILYFRAINSKPFATSA